MNDAIWEGHLTHENAEEVARRLEAYLFGKTFAIASYFIRESVRPQLTVMTGCTLEPISGVPILHTSDKPGKEGRWTFIDFTAGGKSWSIDCGGPQQPDEKDPYAVPFLKFFANGQVTISRRYGPGSLAVWTFKAGD